MKKLIILVAFIAVFITGCINSKNKTEKSVSLKNNDEVNEAKIDYSKDTNPVVTIEIKEYGKIKVELYPEVAPNTVNNFIDLINSRFYNSLTIHRVVKDFVIQGGDPKGNGSGGPGYVIKGEFKDNNFENKLKHTKGVISMARSQDNDSAGSQIFIMTEDNKSLDGKYAAFGKVTEGLDVVDKLNNVKTNGMDKPETDIVINEISIDTKNIDYPKPEIIK